MSQCFSGLSENVSSRSQYVQALQCDKHTGPQFGGITQADNHQTVEVDTNSGTVFVFEYKENSESAQATHFFGA